MHVRSRTTLVVIAFVAFVSLGLPDGVLGVAWPSIRKDFSLPVSQLGLLLATSMVGYLASTAGSGEVLRRLGVGKLLVVSSMLVVLSLAGYALAPFWWVMVACGVLAGLGAGAIRTHLSSRGGLPTRDLGVDMRRSTPRSLCRLGSLGMTSFAKSRVFAVGPSPYPSPPSTRERG